MKEILTKNEKQFLLTSLATAKLRVDGRKPNDLRTITIKFGQQRGDALVSLGNTKIFASVSAEITEPYPDREAEGFFQLNVELSPMATLEFEPGRPSELAIELVRVVERGMRESRAIDTEALCIIAGKKVWSVRCDLRVLDHDGNLIDCASVAALAALLHFRRPEVTINGDRVIVHSPLERDPVPLHIHHMPICVTFAFFLLENQRELMVVDPNYKEEQAMNGRMTMTLNIHKELCAIQKAGGVALEVSKILECARIAAVKVAEITEIIRSALAKEEHDRKQKRGVDITPSKRIAAKSETPTTSVSPLSTPTPMELESTPPLSATASPPVVVKSLTSENVVYPVSPSTKQPPPVAAVSTQPFEGGKSTWDQDEDTAAPAGIAPMETTERASQRIDSDEEDDTVTLVGEFAEARRIVDGTPPAVPSPAPAWNEPIRESSAAKQEVTTKKKKKKAPATPKKAEIPAAVDLSVAIKKKPSKKKN